MKFTAYLFWILTSVGLCWTSQETTTLLKLLEIGEKNRGFPNPNSVLIFGSSEEYKTGLINLLISQDNSISEKSLHNDQTNISSPTSFPSYLPRGLVDLESSVTFYNRPGLNAFSYENKSMEIASAFFVSKLVGSISGIKLLLVSQLSILRNPKRQSEFNRMLQKTSILIANFKEFFNSIALVVINDDKTVTLDSYQLVSDVVTKVSQLCEKAPDQYKPFTEKFNQVISTTDENGNYTRVIVIDPFETEPIEVDWLKQIVHNELVFHQINEGDLIIKTSKSSRDLIQSTLGCISENLTQLMNEVATLIKSRYLNLPNDNFLIVYHELKMLNKFLSELLKSDVTIHATGFKLYYKKLVKELNALQEQFTVQLSNQLLEDISKNFEYIYYLRKLGNLKLEMNSDFLLPLELTASYIRHLYSHYSCLHNFYIESMSLRTQAQARDLRKDAETFYNLISISDRLKQYEKINNTTCIEGDVIPDKVKRSVFQYALKESAIYECVDNATNLLRVYGDFVVLTSVNTSYCSLEELKALEIFAWNKIFIDATEKKFTVPGLKGLTLIAPSVEIRHGSEIDLSGRNGEAHGGRALDGNDLSKDGKDGLQGRSGDSGGSVLIITGSITSTSPYESGPIIHITSNGGNGGTGQDGGNGGTGDNGSTAKDPTSNEEIDRRHGFELRTDNKQELFVVKRGSPGHPGGKGGDGGPGGTKGLGGEIEVVIVNHKGTRRISNDHFINITSLNGTEGSCGKGGVGGLGGLNGPSLVSKNRWGCSLRLLACSKSLRDEKWVRHGQLKGTERGPQGLPGGCPTRHNNDMISRASLKSNSIVAYKRISCKSIPTSEFRKSVHKPFLESLETADLSNYYNGYGLIDEFNFLNEQLRNQNNNSYGAWKSFSKRLSKLLESFGDSVDPDLKIVTEYLYAVSLSELPILHNNIDQIHSSQVITNIGKYLEAVVGELISLQNLRKSQVIQQHRDKYVKDINESIAEADGAIQQLNDALKSVNKRIVNSMDDLINEVCNLQKQAQSNKELLKEAKKKLSHNFLLQKIFGVINTIGSGLTFLGPKGLAAGLIVQGVSSVVHNALAHKDISIPSSINLPAGMSSNYLAQIDAINPDDNELSEFNQTISDIHDELIEFKNVQGVSSVLTTIASIKRELMSPKVSQTQLQNYTNDIEKQLQKSEITIQQSTKPHEPKFSHLKKAYLVVKKCKKVYSFYKRFRKVYKKLRNNAEKLSTAVESVDNQLNTYDLQIQQIQEYHDILQNKIHEDVSQAVGNIVQFGVGSGNQSLIGLDLSSWNVQTTLRNLKSLLESVTRGTNSSEDLLRCIEMLEDTMRTVILIYQRQQGFKDQIRLADFIATIERGETLPIKDENLKNIVENIDLSIRSNLIRNEFQTILNVVKQWTFPFAQKYTQGLELWSFYPIDNKPSSIIHIISRNIHELKERISKKEASISQFIDEIEYSATFDAAKPFFAWNNKEYSTPIKNLLRGHEVAFYADIKKSPKNKDAIRFTSVKILFRAANTSVQKTVDDLFQNFRFRMRHLGRSYYRFEDSFFVISNSNLTLEYEEAPRNHNGDILRNRDVNNAYSKLESGNSILSPYGMWNFQIESDQVELSMNASLIEFLGKNIDVVLVGKGSYVQRQPAQRNLAKVLELNSYYNEVQL